MKTWIAELWKRGIALKPGVEPDRRPAFLSTLISGFIAMALGSAALGSANATQPDGSGLQLQFYPGITITGAVGTVHSVEYTTDLSSMSWNFVTLLQLTNTAQLYFDSTATNASRRFYRAVKIAPATFEELQLLPEREQRFFRSAMGLPELVWIAPGNFVMGSPSTETGRGGDEGPQTQVTLTRGFYMGEFEVSQSEFAKVNGGSAGAFPIHPNLPVEMVSWQEAALHCQRLTQREATAGRLPSGFVYRLPTEAEWEYACRAGKTTRYSFGDDLNGTSLGLYAWFGDVTAGETHLVGTKLPNPWGLHDMHGNVWELCFDALTYTGGSVTNPVGAGSGKMTRGGSWHSLAPRCRSATRNPYPDVTQREAWVGFRVVLGPPAL